MNVSEYVSYARSEYHVSEQCHIQGYIFVLLFFYILRQKIFDGTPNGKRKPPPTDTREIVCCYASGKDVLSNE